MTHPLLFFYIVDEGIRLVMFLVSGVFFAPYFLPSFKFRKEHIGFLRCVMYLRQAKTIGNGKGLLVDARASDDVHVFFL